MEGPEANALFVAAAEAPAHEMPEEDDGSRGFSLLGEAVSDAQGTPRPLPEPARCLVLQPLETSSDPNVHATNEAVYEALQRLEHARPSFPIRLFRTREEGEPAPARISECIASADFCIADITQLRPNVLFEAGVAKGMRRQLFLIGRGRVDAPADLQGTSRVTYDMGNLEELSRDIGDHLYRMKAAFEILRASPVAGIQYFSRRDDARIEERIALATGRIDILQTNLGTTYGTYLPYILEALQASRELRLRILTLDPQSTFVNHRGRQLGFEKDIGVYRDELDMSVRGLHSSLSKFGDRVQIRVYDDFPNQITFFFDSDVLASVLSAREARSRWNPAFLLRADSPGARKSFDDHFEHLWSKKSTPFGKGQKQVEPSLSPTGGHPNG